MNYLCVVIIYLTSCFVLAAIAADEKSIQKRFIKLKNVNYNKTEAKPKPTVKKQKNKTIFLLSNPVIYPQKAKVHRPKPTEAVSETPHTFKVHQPKPTEPLSTIPSNTFDFLNFDAYILKPLIVNYTALLSRPNDDKTNDYKTNDYKTNDYNTNDYKTNDYKTNDYKTNDYKTNDYKTNDYKTNDHETNDHKTNDYKKNDYKKNDYKTKDFVKEYKSSEETTNYPQFEVLDFGRAQAQPLIQTTTISTPYETTQFYETTSPKVSTNYPLGLAYFDSLRKYRKAFDTLRNGRKGKGAKSPRTTTAATTIPTTTATETEAPTRAPYFEPTISKEYIYETTPSLKYDEDYYREKEPYFESYRSQIRFGDNDDYDYRKGNSRYETTTRSLDYATLDNDDNHYEAAEIATTKRPSRKSKGRKSKKNLHSANVKSNFLYDRFINYPQGDESRRVVSVARLDNNNDVRRHRNDTQTIQNRDGGSKQPNSVPSKVPMQRHYFQYVNVINDGTYNAGAGKGNQNHYIEQHELSVPKNGTFQKKVRWNDKEGGFGELYYDLNHH